MTLRFLPDANVLSEPTRARPDGKVLEKLQRHEAAIALGSVVLHELRFGAEQLPPSRRRAVLQVYIAGILTRFPLLPYDGEAAEWHAIERARLVERGRIAPFADAQIAAIARVNDLVLVTRNTRHFAMFRDLEVACWHSG